VRIQYIYFYEHQSMDYRPRAGIVGGAPMMTNVPMQLSVNGGPQRLVTLRTLSVRILTGPYVQVAFSGTTIQLSRRWPVATPTAA
jgi:hypothetical protein